MKKLYLLLTIVLFSCSNDETIPTSATSAESTAKNRHNPGGTRNDPTKLTRVVFLPGTSVQRTWFFYPNGLLKRIENAQGQTLESFGYDSNNDLISHTANGQAVQLFTYDNAHHITNIATPFSSNPVSFDTSLGKYTIVYQSNVPSITSTMEYRVDPELLLIDRKETFVNTADPSEDYVDYGVWTSRDNNNLTRIGTVDLLLYTHDEHINPLKQATLPVCRAMSVLGSGNIPGSFMNAHYESTNNVLTEGNTSGAENQIHSYIYNSLGLPVSRTTGYYHFDQLEATALSVLYYYQGDIIPNP